MLVCRAPDASARRGRLALQLADFGTIFPRADIQDTLTPLALDLCTDPVAEVRGAAISQIGPLIALLLSGEAEPEAPADSRTTAFVGTICNMAGMTSCHKRSNFVQICSSLVRALHAAFVTAHLLPHLEPLATDRVANVRLPLAELVVAELLPHEHCSWFKSCAPLRGERSRGPAWCPRGSGRPRTHRVQRRRQPLSSLPWPHELASLFAPTSFLPVRPPGTTPRCRSCRACWSSCGPTRTATCAAARLHARSPLHARSRGVDAGDRKRARAQVLRAVSGEGFEPPPYRSKEPPLTPALGGEVAPDPAGAVLANVAPVNDEEQEQVRTPRNSLGPNGAVAGPDMQRPLGSSGGGLPELNDDEEHAAEDGPNEY